MNFDALAPHAKGFISRLVTSVLLLQLAVLPVTRNQAQAEKFDQVKSQGRKQVIDLENKGWRYFDQNLNPISASTLALKGAKFFYIAPKVSTPELQNTLFKVGIKTTEDTMRINLSAYPADDLTHSLVSGGVVVSSKNSDIQNRIQMESGIQVLSKRLAMKLSQHSSLKSSMSLKNVFARMVNIFLPSAEAGIYESIVSVLGGIVVIGAVLVLLNEDKVLIAGQSLTTIGGWTLIAGSLVFWGVALTHELLNRNSVK